MNQIHLQYNSGKDTSYQNHHTTKDENQFLFSSITHMQATKKVCNTELKIKVLCEQTRELTHDFLDYV